MPNLPATLHRIQSLARSGGDRVRAKVRQNPLRAGIVAVLLTLFLILVVGHVYWRGASWWMKPSIQLTLQTDQTGYAQVFFDHGDGKTTEENSVFLDTSKHRTHELIFAAKRNAAIANIRFDPSNVSGAAVKVWNIRLRGPLGIGERRIPVEALDKPSGLSTLPVKDGVLTLVTERADSWINLRGKKADLTLPWYGFWFAPVLVTLVAAVAATWVFRIAIPWEGSWLTFAANVLALVYFTYLLAFFAVPVRGLKAPWFFPSAWIALGGVGVLLIAFKKGDWLSHLKRQPTLLLLLAFILYFGSRILWMEPENHAPKGEVLHTLVFWGVSGLVFAAAMPHMHFTKERLYLMMRIWWVVAAISAIANMTYYYGFPNGPRFPGDRLIYAYNPVFPAIVGSACYALALLVCAASTPAPRDLRSTLRFLLHLAGIVIISVYIAQCMSRTVVYSLVLALAGAIGALLIRRRPEWMVGHLCAFVLTFALSFGPLPAWIARQAAPPVTPPAALAHAPAPDKADWTEFEEQNLGGRNRMLVTQDRRQAIWGAYWQASQKHLLFGHGFTGVQGVVVEKFKEMGVFEDGIPKPTSAHSVYMSALYYGGILGLLITAGIPLSVFGCSVWYFLRTGDPWQLVPALLAVIGGLLLAGECAIIAQLKESVLCWRPNGYWVAAWGVFLAGIIQQSLMSHSASSPSSPAHGN